MPGAKFSLAIDERFGKEEKTIFVNCTVWGKQATFITTYCKKGDLVAVDGRLNIRSYENKEGNKVNSTEVVVERVEKLSSSKSNSNNFDKETVDVEKERQKLL
jgi:single-strand DNA-binding protein